MFELLKIIAGLGIIPFVFGSMVSPMVDPYTKEKRGMHPALPIGTMMMFGGIVVMIVLFPVEFKSLVSSEDNNKSINHNIIDSQMKPMNDSIKSGKL